MSQLRGAGVREPRYGSARKKLRAGKVVGSNTASSLRKISGNERCQDRGEGRYGPARHSDR